MKAGEVVGSFTAKNGFKVTLRTPKWSDLDELLSLINSLVKEGAEIGRDTEISRDAELEWLAKTLVGVERDEVFFLVAETAGKVIASSSFRARGGYAEHVADLGIVVKKGYRDIGVGIGMMTALVERARKLGLEMLALTVFASNKRAMHIYEKVGFVQVGRIPKAFLKDDEYVDQIIMVKALGDTQ
jgi:L-amino acid N-acyltransferase YncA